MNSPCSYPEIGSYTGEEGEYQDEGKAEKAA